jgi:two-component system KDP operon response regulator KdpE
MPDMDGYSVCERIRGLSTVPIIMLTALGQPEEVVKGLDLGADDYIVKPYNKDVLLARTRANLRRIQYEPPPSSSNDNSIYSDGYLTINLKDRRVKIDQEPIKLSPTEFGLLEVLFQERPRVVPYRNLLERVWGFEYIDDIDYLRVYIWHLRHKLEPNPKEPTYIHNELGVGYRFEGVK